MRSINWNDDFARTRTLLCRLVQFCSDFFMFETVRTKTSHTDIFNTKSYTTLLGRFFVEICNDFICCKNGISHFLFIFKMNRNEDLRV